MIFPIIINGMMTGTAAIIGLPVIMKDVTGEMTDKMIPLNSPLDRTASMIHVLTIGPVMNWLVVLNSWLIKMMARSTAVIVISCALKTGFLLSVEVFIFFLPFLLIFPQITYL